MEHRVIAANAKCPFTKKHISVRAIVGCANLTIVHQEHRLTAETFKPQKCFSNHKNPLRSPEHQKEEKVDATRSRNVPNVTSRSINLTEN